MQSSWGCKVLKVSIDVEETLKYLGIPTELNRFVNHLSPANLPWEELSEGLLRINRTFSAMENKVEMQNEALIEEVIEMLLQLPIEVSLPLTFAEPMDPQLGLVLKSLKDLARMITELCLRDLPKRLKLKLIRSQVHLYSIAANIPLGIAVLSAVAILRMCLDNIIKLINTTAFAEEEFRELMDRINFGPISFDRMVVGEIGFSFFRTRETEAKKVKSYLKRLCRALTEFRASNAAIQVQALRRITPGNSRIGNPFSMLSGLSGTNIFEQTFLVAGVPDLLTKWLKDTLQTAADLKHAGSSSDGTWGSMQIFRHEGNVNSHISLSSFFGKPHEYRIVTLHVNL